MTSVHDSERKAAFGELTRFRLAFYACLTARADALFELADAVLCTEGPVRSLVGLSLAPEHRVGLFQRPPRGRPRRHRLEQLGLVTQDGNVLDPGAAIGHGRHQIG